MTVPPSPALRAPLVLASASPRRQEILRLADWPFVVAVSPEEPRPTERLAPAQRAIFTARAKAGAVAPEYPGQLVVGADTIVVRGREVLDKPADAAAARRMLASLSGRPHEVFTGLAIVRGGTGEVLAEACEQSQVIFRRLTETEIAAYVATGDPLDKAGAYGIQSQGGDLVAAVYGSYLNVVGLPLARLRELLAGLGWTMWETDENEATSWRPR